MIGSFLFLMEFRKGSKGSNPSQLVSLFDTAKRILRHRPIGGTDLVAAGGAKKLSEKRKKSIQLSPLSKWKPLGMQGGSFIRLREPLPSAEERDPYSPGRRIHRLVVHYRRILRPEIGCARQPEGHITRISLIGLRDRNGSSGTQMDNSPQHSIFVSLFIM